MKNVLFTTTALVALGGMAYADAHAGVALSGSAEMGLTYIDEDGADSSDTSFHNDIDVTFTMSGATDNGLTFGASIDLDEADGDAEIESSNSVFIQGSFGTLSMGDVDGAYDKAMIEIAAAGLNDEADQVNGHAGLDGWFGLNNGEVLRYDYSFGDLTLSLSAELGDSFASGDTFTLDNFGSTITITATADGDLDDIFGVGAGYSTSFGGTDLQFGVGYQVSGADFGTLEVDAEAIGVSAKAGFGDLTATVAYEMITVDTGADDITLDTIGVSVEYSFGAAGVGLQYETREADNAGASTDTDTTGIWLTYDLGGGAEFVAAASQQDVEDVSTTRAGFGLALSF